MADLDLCYLTATEAIEKFKARQLSPVELTQAVIARAEEVEPKINAFSFRYYDEALEKAKAAEARYMKSDGRLRPLEGLPVAVKDESFIKGQVTSNGSLMLKDEVASFTSPNAERLLRAGAIVHARTTTPEFSCSGVTQSRIWGVTRNPWNLEYTPGGSSGGSGASLAAGSTTLATGSDIGGSIRIPASASGVAGLKPTYGRNPDDHPFNLDAYCHTGPMARSIDDLVLMQNVLCGPHPQDIVSIRPKLRIPRELKGIEGWKIAYSPDLGYVEIDPEVRANTEAALEAFRAAGATVEEVELGWTWSSLTAAHTYLAHLFGTYIGRFLGRHALEMTTYARAFGEAGRRTTAEDFLQAQEVAGEMYAELGPILQRYDALLCPTLAVPSVSATHDQSRDRVEINGREVDPLLGWTLTYPFNMLSRCPVISVPTGFAKNGVPTGLQIVGRTYDDIGVCRAAKAFEAERPWRNARPHL